jgi:hypothetical protein
MEGVLEFMRKNTGTPLKLMFFCFKTIWFPVFPTKPTRHHDFVVRLGAGWWQWLLKAKADDPTLQLASWHSSSGIYCLLYGLNLDNFHG